jgi:uncharacterized protein (TIGR02099 family)
VLKSAWNWASRGILVIAAVLLVLLGLYVSLGRYYVPMIRDSRDDVVQYLKQRTGLDIDIAHIEGEWHRFYPLVTLDQLVVRPPDDSATPLYFTQIKFAPDIVRSVLTQSLVIRELRLFGLRLQLQQLDDGRWQLHNLKLGDGKTPLDVDRVIAWIYQLGVLQVDNAEIVLTFADGRTREFHDVDLHLENQSNFRRLQLDIDKNARTSTLALTAEGRGDFRKPASFNGNVYLALQHFAIPKIETTLREPALTLNIAEISGQVWLDFGGRKGVSAVTRLSVPKVRWAYADGSKYRLDNLRLPLHARYDYGDDLLQVYSSTLQLDQAQGSLWNNLRVQWNHRQHTLAVASQSLDVDATMAALLRDPHLMSEGLHATLGELAPAGALHNLWLTTSLDAQTWKQQLRVRANLADVSVQPWKGAPGATGVNGYLESGIENGYVDLDSDNLALSFPHLFPAPIPATHALGRVGWRVTDERVLVDSSVLDLQMDAGHANGLLQLDLRRQPGVGVPPVMYLGIGLTNSDAKYRNWFVPRILSPTLLEWLDNSLSEGRVPQAGFVFYGPLIPLENEKPAIQLFVDADNTRLQYWTGWPAVDGISGRMLLDNGELDVDVPTARMYGLTLTGNEVTLRAGHDGPELAVTSKIDGPANDALKFIQQSPVHKQIGGFLRDWSLTGNVDGHFDLNMPLGPHHREVEVKVDAALADNNLKVGNTRLAIEKLSGKLHFETGHGLSSDALLGELWHRPVKIGISSEMEDASMRTTISSRGRVAMTDLAQWTHLRLLGFANGDALARMTITARKGVAKLALRSSLRGVNTDLPAPFGKVAEDAMPLGVTMPLSGERRIMRISLGSHTDTRVLFTEDGADSVVVGVNRRAHTHFSPRTVQIAGDFEVLDLDTWQDVFRRYNELPAAAPAQAAAASPQTAASDSASPAPVGEADDAAQEWHIVMPDLRAWQLRGFGKQISYARIAADMRGDDWQVWLVNDEIVGNMSWPRRGDAPIRLELNRFNPTALRPVGEETTVDSAAPVKPENAPQSPVAVQPAASKPIDFGKIPAIDVIIHQLSWGQRALGSWRFDIRSDATHLYAHEIVGNFADMTIDGGNKAGGELAWARENGVETTSFNGQARAGDFAKVLDNLGYEQMITTESASFDIAMQWAGAPSEYSVEALKGEILLDMRKGAFLNAPSGANSTLKVVSFLNLNNILKRLQLDFSDLSQRGYAFDKLKGSVTFDHGVFSADDPILVDGSSSEVRVAGDVYWPTETLDMEIAVTLPIGSNLPWVAALTGYGLPVAAGVYVASKVLKEQVDKLSSVVYRMQGPWGEPQVTMRRLFNDSVTSQSIRKGASKKDGANPPAIESPTTGSPTTGPPTTGSPTTGSSPTGPSPPEPQLVEPPSGAATAKPPEEPLQEQLQKQLQEQERKQ